MPKRQKEFFPKEKKQWKVRGFARIGCEKGTRTIIISSVSKDGARQAFIRRIKKKAEGANLDCFIDRESITALPYSPKLKRALIEITKDNPLTIVSQLHCDHPPDFNTLDHLIRIAIEVWFPEDNPEEWENWETVIRLVRENRWGELLHMLKTDPKVMDKYYDLFRNPPPQLIQQAR